MSTKSDQGQIALLQGTLDLLILRTLRLGPAHGHAIVKAIESGSDDVLLVEQGSLYPALHRLIERGWITFDEGTSENNRRAKFYRLTAKGRKQLDIETSAGRSCPARSRAFSVLLLLRSDLAMRRKRFGMAERQRALDGLDGEIRDHIERETEINIARGMTPDEARRQARLAFGNVTLVQEDARAAWTWTWLEQARQDLRFGARILKNSPGLSVTAAVLIALVIGINTTIYSMINALVTQPAPGVNPEGLVRIAIPERPGAPSRQLSGLPRLPRADHGAASTDCVHQWTRDGDVRIRQLRPDRRGRRCQLLRNYWRAADARSDVHTETKGARPIRPRTRRRS